VRGNCPDPASSWVVDADVIVPRRIRNEVMFDATFADRESLSYIVRAQLAGS